MSYRLYSEWRGERTKGPFFLQKDPSNDDARHATTPDDNPRHPTTTHDHPRHPTTMKPKINMKEGHGFELENDARYLWRQGNLRMACDSLRHAINFYEEQVLSLKTQGFNATELFLEIQSKRNLLDDWLYQG